MPNANRLAPCMQQSPLRNHGCSESPLAPWSGPNPLSVAAQLHSPRCRPLCSSFCLVAPSPERICVSTATTMTAAAAVAAVAAVNFVETSAPVPVPPTSHRTLSASPPKLLYEI
ncbi:uncharacterized protein SPSK_02048 [Sporothrix schenckii 1099-18]|uniref:Uncharacterized protein n=1 Tax=Sporothrix schenckii 1099-18 TaxID=1397361 RepID=A0A0F2MG44_SPOSC|nr:uncharacterized protein SPSK_02048 [Sporothrix schenckii 1099-18]KJR87136.1 hypothetical protein SPSK_02048 [Sporothrix schenckii 1099-18]